MSIDKVQTPIINNNANKYRNPSFTGANLVVGMMDAIERGGYPASFILQDGLGFITPRVGKGLLRGSEQKDENGNPILDKNGKPVRKYNWEYARKEGIREIITGPSAFLIPMAMLYGINKFFGRANNVKLNYIDGFKNHFSEFAKNNTEALKSGTADKSTFYKAVFKDALENSINNVDGSAKLSAQEIDDITDKFAKKQIEIEQIKADKSLNKKEKAAKLNQLGSIENDFMRLKKNRIGGTVNELSVQISSSKGEVKSGSINELLNAMSDYFDDASNTIKKSLKDNVTTENIEEFMKKFTNKKLGSRILTNLGIFGAVAAFYTQIPKLYNMGIKGNPALKGTAIADTDNNKKGKDVNFTGRASLLGKAGDMVFNNKNAKSISDIFELNGPIISGTAMTTLLYGFCIPPRLEHATDKYEFKEVIVRDFTAFTALLFGAKALSRLFSDGFTKLTGLALNKKNLEGRNIFQKVIDYLSPNDTRHSILSSKQLISKYTNIDEYKDGVKGFMEFIEGSGGNIKKAFTKDKNIKSVVERIVKISTGKSYKNATSEEIKQALIDAHNVDNKLIKKFYKLFDAENGLLRNARTCNSTFSFLSTIAIVPGFIMWLTNYCEKMTEKRIKQNLAQNPPKSEKVQYTPTPSNKPTMAGFLKQAS